jgi:hypothetical protein
MIAGTFSSRSHGLDNCVDVVGHYRKSVEAIDLSISVVQAFADDCRDSIVASPNWANPGAVKYPLELRKPRSLKIGFHSLVMGRIVFGKMKKPLTLLFPLADDFCRKRPCKPKCNEQRSAGRLNVWKVPPV